MGFAKDKEILGLWERQLATEGQMSPGGWPIMERKEFSTAARELWPRAIAEAEGWESVVMRLVEEGAITCKCSVYPDRTSPQFGEWSACRECLPRWAKKGAE